MSRLPAIDPAHADPHARALLDAVEARLGLTPNLYRTLAHAPAALEGLLNLGEALSRGRLPARYREQLALVVAQENGCDYCLAAHTAIGGLLRLPADELRANRVARAADPRVEAGLRFARALVRRRGAVTDAEIAEVRAAGHDDAEIAEIVAHVALNTFTNYFNLAADTDLDFPPAPALTATA